jgi:predicted DNA-binding transcriptional regulator AlpA
MENDLLNRPETAAICGVKVCTIDKMSKAGRGPIQTRIGGRIFYRRKHVEQWLKSCEVPPAKQGSAA